MVKQQKQFPGIESLTMNDIVDWAGQNVASRGREYQRNGKVKGLSITANGALLADVLGGECYSVFVSQGEEGLPKSRCTCPFGTNCKHGVAALLEYLALLNNGQLIEAASSDDPRFGLLGMAFDGDEDQPCEKTNKTTCSSSSAKKSTAKISVESWLSELNKEQLISMILGMAKEIPQLRAGLQEKALGHKGETEKLLKNLENEIRRISQIRGWSESWSGEGNIPDYSGVRRKMRTLLDVGCFDGVLEEGMELLELGREQIEMSDDEGQTADEIAECIPFLVEALNASTWDAEDKLLWALDAIFEDEFDVCSDLVDFLKETHPAEAWSLVADNISIKLEDMSPSKGDYSRQQVSGWLIHALENAGRNSEILPLCEAEAEVTGDYRRLVSRLMAEDKDAEALQWIQMVMKRTGEEAPRYTSDLRDYQRRIYRKQEDWQALILLEIEDFIFRPNTEKFTRTRTAAEANNTWPDLRQTLLDFLVSGLLPWQNAKWPPRLSRPEVPVNIQNKITVFPMALVLVEIAMEEKMPEEVARWYAMIHKRDENHFYHDRVAMALQEKFPEQSVGIWKELVEGAVSRTTRNAYAEAGGYLRKMQKTLLAHGMQKEWASCVASLRAQHARKRLFLETLDSMDEKPILKR